MVRLASREPACVRLWVPRSLTSLYMPPPALTSSRYSTSASTRGDAFVDGLRGTHQSVTTEERDAMTLPACMAQERKEALVSGSRSGPVSGHPLLASGQPPTWHATAHTARAQPAKLPAKSASWCPVNLAITRPTLRGLRIDLPARWSSVSALQLLFERPVDLSSRWGPVNLSLSTGATIMVRLRRRLRTANAGGVRSWGLVLREPYCGQVHTLLQCTEAIALTEALRDGIPLQAQALPRACTHR